MSHEAFSVLCPPLHAACSARRTHLAFGISGCSDFPAPACPSTVSPKNAAVGESPCLQMLSRVCTIHERCPLSLFVDCA